MALGQGPSFDDVPASAAPSKNFTSLYSKEDRSQSPPIVNTNNIAGTNRPSLDSPYHHTTGDRRTGQDEMNGNGNRGRDRSTLPPLQAPSYLDQSQQHDYEAIVEDDPTSYDLVAPGAIEAATRDTNNIEKQSLALFSKEHLQVIFGDSSFLLRFTSFLGQYRAQSVPILVHYLDSLKALRAIHYANAILEGLDEVPGLDFTKEKADTITNAALIKRTEDAFDYLVQEELPAFVTHEYIQIVSASISARISGMLAPHLRDASEGLAEVFCLTDPSRQDNPIVFASEEFNRTTQYGMSYVLGRNCRFLQGPNTNQNSIRRIREATKAGRQHQEVFLNYRRDGSPFMNLLMTAPLCDARGVVRYYIGAQVDVTGLVKDCSDMESLAHLLELQRRGEEVPDHQTPNAQKNDELRELAEMLNASELSTVYKHGGRMHRDLSDSEDDLDHEHGSTTSNQPRLLIKDPDALTPPLDVSYELGDQQSTYQGTQSNINLNTNPAYPARPTSTTSSIHSTSRLSGRLSGIYNHYLLIRPYPSLRILFASPSQRIPGILQSPFLSRIGGSNRVREELTAALADGRGVTAKVRWVTKHDEEGRNKWIHCTPLVGINGQIGVWVIVIVDDERHKREKELAGRLGGGRNAPPIASAGQGAGAGMGIGRMTSPDHYASPARTGRGDAEPTMAGGVSGSGNGNGNGNSSSRQQGLGNAPLMPNRNTNMSMNTNGAGNGSGNGNNYNAVTVAQLPERGRADNTTRRSSMNSFNI